MCLWVGGPKSYRPPMWTALAAPLPAVDRGVVQDVQSTLGDGRLAMLDSSETTSRFVDRLPSAEPGLALRVPDPDMDDAQRDVEPAAVHSGPLQDDGAPVVLPAGRMEMLDLIVYLSN